MSEEVPNKICPLMLVSRNHKDLSQGVPDGAHNGNYSCLGTTCMAFRASDSSCGLVVSLLQPTSGHCTETVQDYDDKFE